MMRELVHRYLSRNLSRRGFIRRMVGWGFSTAAATAILDSLAPLAESDGIAAEGGSAAVVEGSGGDLLVAQLRAAGVRFLFNCNSSGTYPIFDALMDHPDIQVIAVPQEGQMVAVAQGYTLASGETAFTVNGSVGFPNTLNNMYNAWKDRTPLVVASQREPTAVQGGRDAFEEWDDYLGPAASFTRWRWSVDQAERIPEITRRAFKIAATPPCGPVALAFPEDLLAAGPVKSAIVERARFLIEPEVRPDPRRVEQAARWLLEAKSPVLVLGPEVTRSGAKADVVQLAEQLGIVVTQGEHLFDDFPTDHPLFVGDFPWALGDSSNVDLIVNLGAKMPDEDRKMPGQARVVHASIDPAILGAVVPTDLAIVGGVKETTADLVSALASAATQERLEKIRAPRLAALRTHSEKARARRAEAARARWDATPLSWERVAGELDRQLERDAIIVPELAERTWLEYGDNVALNQFTFAPNAKSRIGRTTGSALGWGVGAALGVKLARPDRQVVALQGDGGFLFAQAETLWTMARYEVPILIVIFNNRSYNGPRNRILQRSGKQGRDAKEMTCYLGDPDVDFAKVAAGFGVRGEVVRSPGEVAPAIRRAIESTRDGRPYLIDAIVARTGLGAESTWYPKYSVAAVRTKKV